MEQESLPAMQSAVSCKGEGNEEEEDNFLLVMQTNMSKRKTS